MSSEPNHNRQKNHKALTKKQKEAIRRKKRQRNILGKYNKKSWLRKPEPGWETLPYNSFCSSS